MRLSYSQINSFKRCPKKWEYGYRRRLMPIVKSKPLTFGGYMHELLKVFYLAGGRGKLRGEDLNNAIKKRSQRYFKELSKDLTEEQITELTTIAKDVEAIMENYVNKYMTDLDKWTIIGVEVEFEIPIKSPTGEKTEARLYGIFDLIVQDEYGNIWLVEHKTTADSVENRTKHIMLDEQMHYYVYALTNMFEDEGLVLPIAGVIYNVIRKKLPTVPKTLVKGGLSKAKDIDTTVEVYRAEVIRQGLCLDDYKDIISLLEYKGDKFFGREITNRTFKQVETIGNDLFFIQEEIRNKKNCCRNFDSFRCNWDCSFIDLCIMELMGGDTDKMIADNFTIKPEEQQEEVERGNE